MSDRQEIWDHLIFWFLFILTNRYRVGDPLWLGQITVVRKNGFFSTSPWWNISTEAFPERTHQAGRFEMRRVAFTLEMRFVIRKTSNGIFYYSIILLCDDDNDNDDNDGGGDDDNGAAPIIEPSSHLRDGREGGRSKSRIARNALSCIFARLKIPSNVT